MRFRSSLAVGFSWLLGCGASVESTPDDASDVTTGVGGDPGHVVNTTSGVGASGGAGASGGEGGGGGALLGPPYPIVLAHGFFGFNDFAGAGFLTYFYGVKENLEAEGEVVYTPSVDPFNDSTFRGAQLIAEIEAIRAETGSEKVVIIGHSQGGLDARVVAHDRPDLVAAVITIATPHGGSYIADVVLELIADPNAQAVVNEIVNLIGAPLYDQIGDETAVTKPLYLFSQAGIAAFDAAYPDSPGIFYASIGGRTDNQLGGIDCAPTDEVPFIEAMNAERDPVDPLFSVAEAILDGNDPFNPIVNDGLVRARDARHGVFWGCLPADHVDEVGQILGDGPGFGNEFVYAQFYRDLVAHLRTLGY